MANRSRAGYLPGLDGWRAISILAVMFAHDAPRSLGPHSVRWLQDFGGSFVRLFFAISGYLICTRILEEEQLAGRFRIRDFYVRRVFRIQPAALVYLLAVALLTVAAAPPQSWRYWFGALFLYRNYQIHLLDPAVLAGGFLTGHFWTLAVEEHFYLLLSLFLFFVRSRRLLWGAIFAGLSLAWMEAAYAHPTAAYLSAGFRQTGTQLNYLVIPALLALLLRRDDVRGWARRCLQPGLLITGSIVLIALVVFAEAAWSITYPHSKLPLPFWHDLFARVWPFWIIATVLHPESATTRFLEAPPLRWIGRLSYSLYLWHVLFFQGPWAEYLVPAHRAVMPFTRFPWNILGSFGCAALSFYFVEKPLMRLGHRLAPPVTPGRLDLGAAASLDTSNGLPPHVASSAEARL